MQFHRSISTFGLLFAAVGGIVGSGWLFGPFFAAKIAGPSALLSWILGGCLMMVIALTFAELASSFPLTGGTVRFLQLSHGPLVSFSMAWIVWLASVAIAPVETMALLNYASSYLPWLMYQKGGVHLLTLNGIGIAAIIMFILCVINSVGVHFLSKTNNIVVIIKLIVPIMTLVLLFTFSFHVSNFTVHGFTPMGIKGLLTALPQAGVIFSFIGYSPAIQLAGEVRNPQRSIPIAIIGALCICIVLYALLQIVFIGAVSPSSFANGWQVLSFKGDAGPFAGIAIGLGALWLVRLIYIDAVISPFGTALIHTASAARMCYAMSKNGYFPASLLKLNRFGIPGRIIVLNFLIGMFFFLPFPTWQNMMSFLVSSLVFAYAVGPLALVVLRKTLPDHPRPFKVPVVGLWCLLAFFICNLIVFWTGWSIVSKMMVAIAVGYIVLIFFKMTKTGRDLNLQLVKSWWMFFYIAIMGMISFLGSFGGGRGVIPFGWDFIVIALVSWLIFELSKRCALEAHETMRQMDDEK